MFNILFYVVFLLYLVLCLCVILNMFVCLFFVLAYSRCNYRVNVCFVNIFV